MVQLRLTAAALTFGALAACAMLPGPRPAPEPIISSSGLTIELQQSRPPSQAQRQYAQKIADDIWTHACSSGAARPCNDASYYRMSMTLRTDGKIDCLGAMKGPLADQAAPFRTLGGAPRHVSPWTENVSFRCLGDGQTFIESWY
jgi:hypothetical protein